MKGQKPDGQMKEDIPNGFRTDAVDENKKIESAGIEIDTKTGKETGLKVSG